MASNPTDNPDLAARDVIEKCGYAAAAVTLLPIPLTEHVVAVPIHVGMVVTLGNMYGYEMTRDSAQELVMRIGATVGLSLIGSRLGTTAAKIFLPGLGGVISAPFMYASTLAIGAVAKMYFKSGGEISNQEIKRVYKRERDAAKKDYNPARAKSKEARNIAEEAAAKAKSGDKDAVVDLDPGAAKAAPTVSVKAKEKAQSPKAESKDSDEDPIERLEKLKGLLAKGLIDQAEYDEHKQRILAEL